MNTGEVVAGDSTDGQRLVTGDAVNVANRLCSAAGPGEILVSEALCQVVKERAEYEYLPEMALRGRTRAVQVYRVKGFEL